jgi:UDP-2-acetamido-2-deoxy-ribo-hexuluronate aminotransferase
MTDLLLDASAVAAVCGRDNGDASWRAVRKDLQHQNRRVWLYLGELGDILEYLAEEPAFVATGDSEDQVTAAGHTLADLARDCQWLAALAEDAHGLDDPDPMAAVLARAASRLGEDTQIITANPRRLSRGQPFVDAASVLRQNVEASIGFIDLQAQQDRLRPQLESNLHRVLHHGRYVIGPEITELEAQLAGYVGVEHCICVSSGTDALLIAMMALGIGPGDEVITSPFTFIATGEMITLLGAKPVYVDIDPATFNIDADRIEAAVTDRTRIILPVSLYGQCADMDTISAIATRHELTVIEDAAQSFGATYKGRRSGALSDIACTSFFPAKPLGAYGDAGACFTRDEKLAATMRQVRDHGQDRRYHHVRLGINGRMDTLQAAVLLAKMSIFDDELQKRQAVVVRYAEQLAGLEHQDRLVLPWVHPDNTSSWAQYTLRASGRDALQTAMVGQGIPTAVHYPMLLYDQPALVQPGIDCAESDRAAREVISLPIHPYLEPLVQARITAALKKVLATD